MGLTMDEVEEAVRIYDSAGVRHMITLLQCTSAYPADPTEANLRVIQTLQEKFCCSVGYSDHTLGSECALAAVALGAIIVEKHFTLDRGMSGPDHAASATPDEFRDLVNGIRLTERAAR